MTTTAKTQPTNVRSLLHQSQALFHDTFPALTKSSHAIYHAIAPGRVNLIGEHVDYTGGYVLPLAIGYSTVVCGCSRKGTAEKGVNGNCRVVSANMPGRVVEFTTSKNMKPLKGDQPKWANYVVGVVAQYMEDVPDEEVEEFSFDLAVAGDVPLGSGLSSSASLEVAVARFVECLLDEAVGGQHAFSGAGIDVKDEAARAKTRALRCQKAENVFCNSPCGIMDQYVSSAAREGSLLLIDCTSFGYKEVKMGAGQEKKEERPVIVVANSNVTHDIAGGEYPVRVEQCKIATEALKKVNPEIRTLRDATLDDVERAKEEMEEVIYKRARHVVTENERTVQAAEALELGDWKLVGQLMNGSHESMRTDYEVSCEEIDILVDLAQSFAGVHGSRLTGGGFGGCTVTLVRKDCVGPLIEYLKKEYKERTGQDCDCFETSPGDGARKVL